MTAFWSRARAVGAAMALSAVFLVACSEVLTAPVGGEVGILMIRAPLNVGAVRLTVEGPGIESVTSDEPYIFVNPTSPEAYEVIVAGALTSQTIARVQVRNRLEAYRLTVHEAAAKTTYALIDPSQFTLRMEPR